MSNLKTISGNTLLSVHLPAMSAVGFSRSTNSLSIFSSEEVAETFPWRTCCDVPAMYPRHKTIVLVLDLISLALCQNPIALLCHFFFFVVVVVVVVVVVILLWLLFSSSSCCHSWPLAA